MPAPSIPAVRPATTDDIAPVSRVLARAFNDDPVTTWIFGEDRIEQRLEGYFASHLSKIALRHGTTFTTDAHQGAAIWLPPGAWELKPVDMLRSLPGAVRALGWRLPSALRSLIYIEKHHPRAPHYYLATLGTDPDQQGKGIGSALLAPILERCDREGLPAYLESSKERNVPFYARHGFEVTKTLTVPKGGPPLWLMWREPKG